MASIDTIKALSETIEDGMVVYPEERAMFAHATVIYSLIDLFEDSDDFSGSIPDEYLTGVLDEMNTDSCFDQISNEYHLDVIAALSEMNEAFYRIHAAGYTPR